MEELGGRPSDLDRINACDETWCHDACCDGTSCPCGHRMGREKMKELVILLQNQIECLQGQTEIPL